MARQVQQAQACVRERSTPLVQAVCLARSLEQQRAVDQLVHGRMAPWARHDEGWFFDHRYWCRYRLVLLGGPQVVTHGREPRQLQKRRERPPLVDRLAQPPLDFLMGEGEVRPLLA